MIIKSIYSDGDNHRWIIINMHLKKNVNVYTYMDIYILYGKYC